MLLGLNSKNSITAAEVTKEQMLSKAVPEIGLYIDFGAFFWYFFGQAKKYEARIKKKFKILKEFNSTTRCYLVYQASLSAL